MASTHLQVITPGYRIILEAQGQRYEYHTDQQRSVVRCSPSYSALHK